MLARKTGKPLKTITFATPPDVAEALNAAAELGFNRSRLIRDAVRRELKKRGFLKN